MYFVPLNQIESVELVIHALRCAGGQADCAMCPARKVCTKQCLAIADAIEKMAEDGTLPAIGFEPAGPAPEPAGNESSSAGSDGFLKVVK